MAGRVKKLVTRCSVDKEWRESDHWRGLAYPAKGMTNPNTEYCQGEWRCHEPAPVTRGLPVLERRAVKVASAVLRGGSGGNAASLPDLRVEQATDNSYSNPLFIFIKGAIV